MSFYSEIVKKYEVIFPLSEVKEDYISHYILNNNYNTMLDIGCATGALVGAMAKILDLVKGFDLEESMIDRAKMFYKNNNIEFKVGNMLEIDGLYQEEKFDFITCFGNTLVHVGKENMEELFKTVNRHMTDSGTFMFQILNYNYIFEEEIKELPLIDNEAVRFDRYYHYESKDEVQFKTVLTVKDTGDRYENQIPLYPIFKEELELWLNSAGFKNVRFIKDYKGNPYDGKHLPLVIMAKR